jgi:hypothetical protein
MPRHIVKALMAGIVGVVVALSVAAPANAAQGGFDRDHYWFKIGHAEMRGVAGQVNGICVQVVHDLGACYQLTSGVQAEFDGSQVGNSPRHGYWAEWYPNRQGVQSLRHGYW